MELNAVHRFIVKTLNNSPDVDTMLPGGVHRSIAPDGAAYPHLIFAYASGMDVNAFGGGYVGSGVQYLLKVLDASESETRAVASFNWVETTLLAASGSPILDTGEYVWLDKRSPFNLPVVEDDETYQQVGRFYTIFVDMP